jgi:tetratricopeptide (TPR) repeat protein
LVHQIANARYSSRCFVMRAMDDEEEGRALAGAFSMLPPAEREQLYSDRKAHKELVIFLHEWAHTLGVLHAEDETLIMNPSTDPRQAAFTDYEKRLIGIVLDRRLRQRAQPFPETADLLRLLETAPPEEGSAKERATVLQELRARAAAPRPGPPSSASPTLVVAAAPRAPAPPPGGAAASGATGAPSVAASRIADAVARLEANDVAGATPLVLEAARLAGAGPADARTLVQIAEAGGAVGALTAAEGALARAGKDAPRARALRGDLDVARCRDALPRDVAKAGVAPDDEPRYVAAYWLALHAVESLNRAAAERRLADLAAAFPASVGRQVVACELELESKRAAVAQKHCEVAVATFDGAVRAHLDLGRIAARGRHEAEAEKQFRRALMFDPADDDGWRELGHLFRQTGSSTEHEQLAREHETLFGKPLPE